MTERRNIAGEAETTGGGGDTRAIHYVVPFAIYVLFMVAADVLLRLGWNTETLRWLYPVKIAVVAWFLWLYRHAYRELDFHQRGPLRTHLIGVAVGIAVFIAWITLDSSWMVFDVSTGFDPTTDGGIDWTLVCIRIAGAVMVVPLMEELFWRAFLLRWLVRTDFHVVEPMTVHFGALAAATALFAAAHHVWLAAMVAGAAYSVLYMRTGALWPAVVAHAVSNALLGIWVITTHNWNYW